MQKVEDIFVGEHVPEQFLDARTTFTLPSPFARDCLAVLKTKGNIYRKWRILTSDSEYSLQVSNNNDEAVCCVLEACIVATAAPTSNCLVEGSASHSTLKCYYSLH